MAQGKQAIQASLQVDLDLSKVRAQDEEVKRIQDQAERRSDELKRRAREISQGLEEDQARVERAVHKFKHKNFDHPLKSLKKGAIGLLAADIASGFEMSGADSTFLARAGSAALFALPGGPEAVALAELTVIIHSLVDAWKDNAKEQMEIKKRVNEVEEKRRRDAIELYERIEQIEQQRLSDQIRRRIEVDQIASDLDYNAFRLMNSTGD